MKLIGKDVALIEVSMLRVISERHLLMEVSYFRPCIIFRCRGGRNRGILYLSGFASYSSRGECAHLISGYGVGTECVVEYLVFFPFVARLADVENGQKPGWLKLVFWWLVNI